MAGTEATTLTGAFLLPVSAQEQVSRLNTEDNCQPIDDVYRGRVNASLKRRDIGPVKIGPMCELFLTEACRLARLPQVARENLPDVACHESQATFPACFLPRSILYKGSFGDETDPPRGDPRMKRAVHTAVLTISIAAGAHAALPGDGATGPASTAVKSWFVSDRSLGCVDPNGHDRLCRADSDPHFTVFYGSANGGAGQPDALAFVVYLNDPTGNAEQAAIAVFHKDASGSYHLVKSMPGIGKPTPGTVRFSNGRVSWSGTSGRQTVALQ